MIGAFLPMSISGVCANLSLVTDSGFLRVNRGFLSLVAVKFRSPMCRLLPGLLLEFGVCSWVLLLRNCLSDETRTPSTLSLVPAAPLLVAILAGEIFLRNLMAVTFLVEELPRTFCEAVPLVSNDFYAEAVVVAGGKTSRKIISVLSMADTVSSGDGLNCWCWFAYYALMFYVLSPLLPRGGEPKLWLSICRISCTKTYDWPSCEIVRLVGYGSS